FADASGAAGVVSLEVTAATPVTEPLGWLRFSAPPQPAPDGKSFTVGSLHAEIGGAATKIEALPASAKPGPGMIRIQMTMPGTRICQPGERFYYTLSTWPEGGRHWQVATPQLTGDLVSVMFSNDAGDKIQLLYNRGPKAVQYDLPADAPPERWLSTGAGKKSSAVVGTKHQLRLPPASLLVLRTRRPAPTP
ncbi:MAG: hypothetical protein WCI73_07820, partial [Phycisphaerae bacterium]